MRTNSLSGTSRYEAVRESLLTGFAITIPLLISLYVLELALGFLLRGLTPLLRVALAAWPGVRATSLLTNALAVGLLVLASAVLGFVVHFHVGETVVQAVDGAITRVPGVGTLYGSVSRITDSLLVSDHHNFRDVKLVESPSADHYMLGFLISESPASVQPSFDGEVQTLFVPLAPNPLMAGFVVHATEDELRDVDMTVEQGMSAIVSLGATEDDVSSATIPKYRADRDSP